jgi:CRISPR-associated protein Cpf1
MENFVNQYQLSKTLRFELKPVGKTLENIQNKGLLTEDLNKAKSYQLMKKTIDGFHKHFIELAMNQVKLTYLESFSDLYYASPERKKEEKYKDELKKVQEVLRKEIVKGFNSEEVKSVFSNIDKKELITEELEKWLPQNKIIRTREEWEQKSKEEKEHLFYFDEKFKNFTTYFGGFHENRKNMYTDKEQSTAIAYRLIHENLPKFLDNVKTFEKLKTVPELQEKCKILYKEIEEYLNINTIDEAFELPYYNEVLTQSQIDVYNLIIGGRTVIEGEKKIQGLNEYINLHNQKQEKGNRIPKLKILYKQILSDRGNISFLPDAFEKSEEVLEAIENYYKSNILCFQPKDKEDTENVLEKVKQLLTEIPSLDLNKMYIRNDKAITDISKAIFGDWGVIKSALEFQYVQGLVIGKKGITAKQEKEKENHFKQAYFSIKEIEHSLWAYRNESDLLKDLKEDSLLVANYFTRYFKARKNDESDKDFDLIANVEAKYSAIKGVLNGNYSAENKLNQDKITVGNIKAFLDALMEVLHFVKPLALPNDSTLEKDENFYSHFEPYFEQIQLLVPLYNKIRNYAAKKPYSTAKFKLNFENSTLLDGWDVNKEEANTSILFKKGSDFYLGIMDKEHNKIFRNTPKSNTNNTYQKINYKLLPGASKMLPKVFFSDKNISFYNPNEEIQNIRNYGTHTKGGSPQKGYEKIAFNISDCRKMIDFFKDSINKHPEWNNFGFEFSDTQNYDSIDAFYREVEAQGYSITYTEIDEEHINELISQSKLYLFQIYNKDFSPFSKGKPNMHTLYWNALFDEENLKNVVYKLNGQAEIFYRKKSIQDKNKIVHKANEAIDNKNPLANKKQSSFTYDVVKDKRYTDDKFQFHVPITLNFKATSNNYINQEVLSYLKNNPDVNIIGLDRGERHLIYLTLINQKGEILQQESLNTIIDKKHNIETPYHTLLDNKEKERANARENWGVIENIKELKEGYVSQVVHKIAKMMVEHNAMVVMEDLNFGFKRGRFKVEKQVYQKLEKMLIDKLNYLVFKDKAPHEVGGIYNALQLTNKFESFQKIGKQSGFLFYVPAWNTSKIDPTTGFVNLFNAKYESVGKSQEFFALFDTIHWNTSKNYFEFKFDYNNFTTRAEGTLTKWTLCTYGERINTFRNADKNNQWDNQEVNLPQQFEDLFGKYNITYGDGKCIKTQIVSQTDKSFFSDLTHFFKLTLQMRNSITNSEVDYLISPAMNSKGEFYDSRKADTSLPKDADANGAYHIAKKGLWVLEQIKEADDLKKVMAISNKEWLSFVQNKK